MKWEKERYAVIVRVRETLERWTMFSPGELVVAAVSGGADSLVLLDALTEIRGELGISLHVLHVDHGVREESGDDASYVEDIAAHYGLPCNVRMAKISWAAGVSPEERLREARYAAFVDELEATGATRLATGHTADDRVETFLMRMLTGAGPRGLGSIPPLRPPYVRPLIRVWGHEIEDYARLLPFPPRLDHTNLDTDIPRNRIRHRLLPLLEEEYNPSVKRALLNEAEMLASLAEIVDGLARECEKADVSETAEGEAIDVYGLRSRPVALRREAIVRSLRRLGLEPEFDLVEDIRRKVLEVGGNPRLDIGGGVSARRVYDRILLEPKQPQEPLPDTVIPGDGAYSIPGLDSRLTVRTLARGGEDPREAAASAETAWLDADKLSFPLRVRGIRPGDRFHPLGAPGRRKLQDFLVDAKVPREDRARVAVVESGGEIAWVMGMRIDDRFKMGDDTTRVTVLELKADEDKARAPGGAF